MARGKKNNDLPEINLFAARFRDLMDHADPKLSQEELGKRLGLSKSSIAFYRDGRSQPDYVNLVKIARFYGVTTDYLLGLTDAKSYDATTRNACDYTGLSEICIKEIRRLLNDQSVNEESRLYRKLGLAGIIDSTYAPEILEQPQALYWRIDDLVDEAGDIGRALTESNTESIIESKKRLQEILQQIDFSLYLAGEKWQLLIKEYINYPLIIKEIDTIRTKIDALIEASRFQPSDTHARSDQSL